MQDTAVFIGIITGVISILAFLGGVIALFVRVQAQTTQQGDHIKRMESALQIMAENMGKMAGLLEWKEGVNRQLLGLESNMNRRLDRMEEKLEDVPRLRERN